MKLEEIFNLFPSEGACIQIIEKICWRNTPQCPYCFSLKQTPIDGGKRHHCNTCFTSYSVLVKTFLQDTRLDLRKWFYALRIVIVENQDISVRELARRVNVNKNTAWYILQRIDNAMLYEKDRHLVINIVALFDK